MKAKKVRLEWRNIGRGAFHPTAEQQAAIVDAVPAGAPKILHPQHLEKSSPGPVEDEARSHVTQPPHQRSPTCIGGVYYSL